MGAGGLYPDQWAGFIPGFPIEQVGDEWHSFAWGVHFLVFRFARVTDQVEDTVGMPSHFLKPAAAGRCLQQARAVLGPELRGQELSDALVLLDGVWDRLGTDQRWEATLTSADFEDAQASLVPCRRRSTTRTSSSWPHRPPVRPSCSRG